MATAGSFVSGAVTLSASGLTPSFDLFMTTTNCTEATTTTMEAAIPESAFQEIGFFSRGGLAALFSTSKSIIGRSSGAKDSLNSNSS